MEGKVIIGPKAVIECTEDIPCNPCMTCCAKHAISLDGDSINSLPVLDDEKCNGCGICVASCPGMAIFVVDVNEGTVALPYEFIPIPEEGQEIDATDRQGKFVCKGIVQKIMYTDKFDHTNVVTIKIPKEYVNDVRGMKIIKEGV
ncbi:MAG: 4Fe-4S binding protein [Clostridia bacterium]|nr:4Fe-4S binding protein [Clostridia bacterium]